MKRAFLLIIFVALTNLYPQDFTGSLLTHIDSIATAIPETEFTNEYAPPSTDNLTSWGEIITNILNGNYNTADSLAGLLSYNVYSFSDTTDDPDKLYYILAKTSAGTNYWGSFVFDPNPLRQKVVIQTPHPVFDTNTDKQGIRIFKNLGARSFFISGTHRCNAQDSTSCAGTTSVCTGLSGAKYRKSDQAHNTNGTFQKTTEILNSAISGLIVIQNHGFSKDPGDPDLIMSNGNSKTPSVDYLSTLKTNLLSIDSTLTFKILHIDTTWTTLTGTTNVQGRLINGSANPCSQSASSNSGRFLHIEQAYSKLRDTEENRNKLSDALELTLPEDPLPVELASFSGNILAGMVLLHWQTIMEVNNYGFEVQWRELSTKGIPTDWLSVGFVKGNGNVNSPHSYSYMEPVRIGKVSNYRLKQIDTNGSYEFSEIITLTFPEDVPRLMRMEIFPNPANPDATVSFFNPVQQFIRISINNFLGEELFTIREGYFQEGYFETQINSSLTKVLGSGIYFVRLFSPLQTLTKKLIITK